VSGTKKHSPAHSTPPWPHQNRRRRGRRYDVVKRIVYREIPGPNVCVRDSFKEAVQLGLLVDGFLSPSFGRISADVSVACRLYEYHRRALRHYVSHHSNFPPLLFLFLTFSFPSTRLSLPDRIYYFLSFVLQKTQTPSKKSAASASSKMAEEDEALIANLKSLADSLLSASNPTTPTNLKTLQSMCDLVKGSTSSMTSVPIPLKVYCGKKEVEEEQQEKKKKKKDDTPQIEEPTYQQQFSSLLHSWYTSSLDAGGISLKKSTSKKRDEECVFYSSLSALLSILAMTLPATIEDKEDTVRLQLAKKKVDEEKALEEKTGKKGDAEKKMVKNKAEEVKNESSDKNGNGNGNEDKKKEEKIDPSLLDHSTPLLPVLYYRLMHGAIIGSMKNPPMESSRENSKEGGELLEWGGEYLRALSFQIGEEYARITTEVDEVDAAAKPPSPKKAKSPKRGGMSDEKEDEEQERPPPLKPSTDDLYG